MNFRYQKHDSFCDQRGDCWVVFDRKQGINGFNRYACVRGRDDHKEWLNESEINANQPVFREVKL